MRQKKSYGDQKTFLYQAGKHVAVEHFNMEVYEE